ncbi:ribbon-helix-helix protein, CopG family [Crocosphaera sp. XPORK-15E]|uniref:ribbon-helix-helix protein, CopG family n=1 Tax=Crocosphaera sp. XPORK-15E TaxID=3110247 RepID=UPI002B21F0FD|nr:ribbon-helix-helix protein, CopG family [Crocosphaera sp. XPORK-15E]MEA5534154.1 ribbon-helix-helix protein, CopG family [Crocosphaera sp. XPORK-15E]
MARTKPKSDKVLTIRLPEKDLLRLEAYCIMDGKTKTEVIRQFIHSLPVRETAVME